MQGRAFGRVLGERVLDLLKPACLVGVQPLHKRDKARVGRRQVQAVQLQRVRGVCARVRVHEPQPLRGRARTCCGEVVHERLRGERWERTTCGRIV